MLDFSIIIIGFSQNNSENSQNIQINSVANVSENISSDHPSQEHELAHYSTKLSGDTNRRTNIKLSCQAINGTIVEPGQTFSFNQVVGNPTSDKGYLEADVIINDRITKGIGGGNCQVSSTLYNAALESNNIEIIERNNHGQKVSYVPEGKDAAVAYGKLDMKFKNNTGSKIKLYMSSDDNNVYAKIVSL